MIKQNYQCSRIASYLFLACAALQLPATAAAVAEHTTALTFVAAGVVPGGDGDLQILSDRGYLLAGSEGLQLNINGRLSTLASGRFESLDSRLVPLNAGRSGRLVSAIDKGKAAVTVMLFDEASAEALDRLNITFDQATPDVACLYLDRRTGFVSLFSIDARGTLEQHFIFDPGARALINVPIRADVAALGAEACAVDDTSESLYVVDEAIGVRRIPASEEADAVAEPWMMPAPWGSLDGEVADISVDHLGTVWALVPDARRVYRRSVGGDVAHFILPAHLEAPVALSVRIVEPGRVTTIAVLDEASRQVYTAEFAALPTELPEGNVTRAPRPFVYARSETAPVRRYGDAADDPAIYPGVETGVPLILGTDKREGLAVYDLDGQRLQFLPVGRLNNVDLVADALLGSGRRTIAAASNRDNKSISLFEIVGGEVRTIGEHVTTLNDVYGLCMYASSTGVYVFINDTDGSYEQYRLDWTTDELTLEQVRSFALPSQPEGCVVDPVTQRIYMGEEAAGVWVAGAEPGGDEPRFVIPTGDALVADVEGMDIYRSGAHALLVVSSQGSNSYAIYDLNDDHRLRLSFEVRANPGRGTDGVSETDGLAVAAGPLPGYPRGILVVQDGRNRMPDKPQNFKIIDWRDVEKLLLSATN